MNPSSPRWQVETLLQDHAAMAVGGICMYIHILEISIPAPFSGIFTRFFTLMYITQIHMYNSY
jgi:hypothetical protein